MERAAHIVHCEGATYAAALSGDMVDHAIAVDNTDLNLLAEQVTEAVIEGDVGLADWLSEELAYGRAAVIGAYFQVDA